MRKDFACIIISHGRPECSTVKVLRECGYTGEIYIVVDDEDKTLPDYIEKYGADVHVFHKKEDYDKIGSYRLRYYVVMFHPDCIKLKESGDGYDWTVVSENAYPKMLSGRYKKGRA